ncbi:M1 family metallopeptidase [Thalassotalea agarivorans]|uniref:Peptidase family M1 n=1 Tax=Thalassotalea agarivorans TaxID=349064 RepID=A0A1I0CUS5_THASX|nr:M1 family metallopeptidase [Thalassotalea agarivorans]SET23576.1 Peptidase family M1 [Thalassotalea agarivorans]
MKLPALITSLLLSTSLSVSAGDVFEQKDVTHQDILRGSITPERAWWDLQHYHLAFAVDRKNKQIKGTNTVTYKVIGEQKRFQIELQPPLKLTKAEQGGQALTIEQDGYTYFITLASKQPLGAEKQVVLHWQGQPHVAVRPPWDGGFTWSQDSNGLPFIATSNQGIGSSIWWPSKDHGYDEPDKGVLISAEVEKPLMGIANGRLVNTEEKKDTRVFHWQVTKPINNYTVNINIGDYVYFGETFNGEGGTLDMDYYVLRENLEKAKVQFKDAPRSIEAFEHWFGPYPFYDDSFKLVEVPYLGMEHQSSVTYGNGYQNGYKGRDLSATGNGDKFDFIIIHEVGHEWFANNITAKDNADLWVHEAFTNYSESLFLEYHFSKAEGDEYVRGTRHNIFNEAPIIGIPHINRSGSKDMYYKGGNMLHTIRQVVNDDKLWREILRGLNRDFALQTVESAQIEAYMDAKTEKDLSKIFDQYLRDYRVPTLEYFNKGDDVRVRWNQVVKGFNMPVRVFIDGQPVWLEVTDKWSILPSKPKTLRVDPNFYVTFLNILGD